MPDGTARRLRVALYGSNGHQIARRLVDHPLAECVAVCEIEPGKLPEPLRDRVRVHGRLSEVLRDKDIDLVSLCSPRRADQAADAVRCLEAGKHVYAEKPCALSEAALDKILAAAEASEGQFREMNGTTFDRPYADVRRLVKEGAVGDVVQVHVQKSYPLRQGDGRPGDENIDGGLLAQAGVHGTRMIEHVAGAKIAGVSSALETTRGNEGQGRLRTAAAVLFALANGGIASLTVNYLNPKSATGSHGDEHLFIHGTAGLLESYRHGQHVTLYKTDGTREEVATSPGTDSFDFYAAHLLGRGEMPLTLDEELGPTRWILRAKSAASRVG